MPSISFFPLNANGRGSLCLVVFGFLVPPALAAGQAGNPIELPPPNAVASTQFTNVRDIRELSDGTLLVGDRLETRLVHIVWDPPAESEIGRIGEGPGEFRGIGPLFPLRGDSTLFIDSYSGRWNLLDYTRIVQTIRRERFWPGVRNGELAGTDTLGHILGTQNFSFPGGSPRGVYGDSLLVLRASFPTERTDTVARIRGQGGEGLLIQEPTAERPGRIFPQNPLGSQDEAMLFPDGWMAIVRLDPYRVDWISPALVLHPGEPLPYQPVEVSDREKCAALARWIRQDASCDPDVFPGWPTFFPPIVHNRTRGPVLLAAPTGHLAVRRTPSATIPGNRYDIVGRDSRLVGTLQLPENETLIGFGRQSVYILAKDDWDLETLRRHQWPLGKTEAR
jgi:hypothetical protein